MLETGHGKKNVFFLQNNLPGTPTNPTCHSTADCPLY